MLTPLSEKDSSLAIVQEAYKNTNTTGNKRDIALRLSLISSQIDCLIFKNLAKNKEYENFPILDGSFSLLKNSVDICETVKQVICNQVLAVYRQNNGQYVKQETNVEDALWLVDDFNESENINHDFINKLSKYIASIIKLVCENIIILNSEKHSDSKIIKVSGQLAKGRNAGFTQDFFHGDLIQKSLDETGIKISSEEIPQWVKWRFAVDYSDPLKAITKTAEHLKITLANENIQKAVKEAGAQMTLEEIKDSFTEAKKLSIAVNNTNPLEAISKIARHLKFTLTNENIQEATRKAGVDMTIEEIKDTFTEEEKWYFAERYKNPLDGVQKVAKHLKSTLTDDKIQNYLSNAGINIMPKKIKKAFTVKIRLHLASYSDPLMACVRYVRKEISYGPHYFCS